LGKDDFLEEQPLPDLKTSEETILKIAKKIKLARQLERFKCPFGGCSHCRPMEKIILGEGDFVGTDEISRDTYVLSSSFSEEEMEAEVI
jgi:hypothetical protein